MKEFKQRAVELVQIYNLETRKGKQSDALQQVTYR